MIRLLFNKLLSIYPCSRRPALPDPISASFQGHGKDVIVAVKGLWRRAYDWLSRALLKVWHRAIVSHKALDEGVLRDNHWPIVMIWMEMASQ